MATIHQNPNLFNYQAQYAAFNWQTARDGLSGLPNHAGINIAYEAVDRHAHSERAAHTALRCIAKDGQVTDISYVLLYEQTNRFVNLLRTLGLRKGSRVFALSRRVPALYYAALGALKNGSIFCPMFPDFGPEPVLQRMSRGNAQVLVTSAALYEKKVEAQWDKLPALQFVLLTDATEDVNEKVLSLPRHLALQTAACEPEPTQEEDPALLHFTSGTTGMPKGALHVHKAVWMHYITGKYVLDFHSDDVYWCTADPGWVTGTSYGIISPLVNGVTNLVDEDEFDVLRWYSTLQQQKVSIWYTSPTAIRRLMRSEVKPREQFNMEKLRLILSVGEPLDAESVQWVQRMFGVPVLDNWWQTETGGIVISNYVSMPVKPGSMGKPLPGMEVGIAETDGDTITLINEPNRQGHLVIRKGWPSMFRAYIHEEERYHKCFKNDWYLTGDLAQRDEDGYYWFVGRADDIIKTSGHMVGPFEVESVLMEHPDVAEAAVIGKPHPMIGELVKAFVVLKNNIDATDALKLNIIAHARKKLGPAVAPKEISFVENLPKTKSGKILRRLLKARELGLPEGDTSTLEKM